MTLKVSDIEGHWQSVRSVILEAAEFLV